MGKTTRAILSEIIRAVARVFHPFLTPENRDGTVLSGAIASFVQRTPSTAPLVSLAENGADGVAFVSSGGNPFRATERFRLFYLGVTYEGGQGRIYRYNRTHLNNPPSMIMAGRYDVEGRVWIDGVIEGGRFETIGTLGKDKILFRLIPIRSSVPSASKAQAGSGNGRMEETPGKSACPKQPSILPLADHLPV